MISILLAPTQPSTTSYIYSLTHDLTLVPSASCIPQSRYSTRSMTATIEIASSQSDTEESTSHRPPVSRRRTEEPVIVTPSDHCTQSTTTSSTIPISSLPLPRPQHSLLPSQAHPAASSTPPLQPSLLSPSMQLNVRQHQFVVLSL